MDYVRYLRSKQTVDNRALNLRVLQSFEAHVLRHGAKNRTASLRVVEVGGGVGAMFMRLLRRDKFFSTHATVVYTIIDVKQDVLLAAQETILRTAPAVLNLDPVNHQKFRPQQSQYTSKAGVSDVAGMHLAATHSKAPIELCRIALTNRISVHLVLGDAIAFLHASKANFDVLIGAAVMDLWEPESTLKTFFASLDKDKGLAAFYFPITFDGTTDFFPESSEGLEFDHQVEIAFHRVMGSRNVLGCETLACHSGRRLIPCLKGLKASINSIGGSTWVVSSNNNDTYVEDEAYFVSCIIDFIQATSDQFEEKGFPGSLAAVARYLACRRKQLSDGTLIYVAHNMDLFGVL